MGKAKSWEVTDEFWKRVEPLAPIHARAADKTYQRKAGGGRKHSEQLSRPLTNIPYQHRIAVFGYPYQMIFAVPYRVTACFIIPHPRILPVRLKARDLRTPYGGL